MSLTLPKYRSKPCSNSFRLIFSTEHSTYIVCEACGRIHYCASTAEEVAGILKTEPERCVKHTEPSISWTKLFKRNVVLNCACGFAGFYEQELGEKSLQIASLLSATQDSHGEHVAV